MKKKLMAAAVIGFAGMSLAACGSKETAETAAGTAAAETTAAETTAAEEKTTEVAKAAEASA